MKNTKTQINTVDFIQFSKLKIKYYKEVITKTIKSYHKFRNIEIITSHEFNICIKKIENIYNKCILLERKINEKKTNISKTYIINELQDINDEFFILIKSNGTNDITDILKIAFGQDYIKNMPQDEIFSIIQEHLTPISFKVLNWKHKKKSGQNVLNVLSKDKNIEDNIIIENAKNCECFDVSTSHKNFFMKVDGIKCCFHNESEKKSIIIYGLLDNVLLSCYENDFIQKKIHHLKEIQKTECHFKNDSFKKYISSLRLKDLIVYSNKDHCNRYIGLKNLLSLMKQKPISQLVKEFVNDDIYTQRRTIINLLIHNDDPETQYLAYLFYDILSNDNKRTIDTKEQLMIYDSLPWVLKKTFKDAMKLTIHYTKNVSSVEHHKIPLEQQICLMRVNNNVKEKAMTKLQEVKAKSEDSGSKARQYLEGLLKIPFGIYKKEDCLNAQTKLYNSILKFYKNYEYIQGDVSNIDVSNLNASSSKEIINIIQKNYIDNLHDNNITYIKEHLSNNKREKLIHNIVNINAFIKNNCIKHKKLIQSGKKAKFLKDEICSFIDFLNINNKELVNVFIKFFKLKIQKNITLLEDFNEMKRLHNDVKNTILNVRSTLDKSVYGHEKAKRQIERIIGQWISGEQTGYCFGFEGSPGIGKTSLAKKGLAKCLTNSDGVSRPFGFIAIGGSSNGSVLDGHNYTYVGSTWGRIVDILMESKCMNPIIFIDELDKVSKTEHGKEIIGILTHLVDPTQNDTFQDKYFNGVDIDLSKALFIFSYNDASLLDRILLDRIHRIKFDNLSVKDKIIITKDYILPEIFDKINLKDVVIFSDEIIQYIIETYTSESGVRKLKELLFEIISEINLELLRDENNTIEYPIHLNSNLIQNKYLKEHKEIKSKFVHNSKEIGVINGLWANAIGQGGIIPIQTTLFPSTNFLELKLTGMQGDVMKESMNVAKTLAYKLTSPKRQKELIKSFKETNIQGLHVHCPEGAVPKDGPSAGTAITVSIYSVLNKKKIKHDIAITGEINLQGYVTAIGGLDLKILGGIKAGVKEFIYPEENKDDFNDFMEKYRTSNIFKNIRFYPVKHINEVFKLVF